LLFIVLIIALIVILVVSSRLIIALVVTSLCSLLIRLLRIRLVIALLGSLVIALLSSLLVALLGSLVVALFGSLVIALSLFHTKVAHSLNWRLRWLSSLSHRRWESLGRGRNSSWRSNARCKSHARGLVDSLLFLCGFGNI